MSSFQTSVPFSEYQVFPARHVELNSDLFWECASPNLAQVSGDCSVAMGGGASVCFDGEWPDLDNLPARPLHRATVRMLKQLLDLHGEVGAAEWAHIAKVGREPSVKIK